MDGTRMVSGLSEGTSTTDRKIFEGFVVPGMTLTKDFGLLWMCNDFGRMNEIDFDSFRCIVFGFRDN